MPQDFIMTMKILKMYVDEPNQWEKTTLEETIHFTEERGYWKKGTVKQMLEDGAVIRTPFAFYKRDNDESSNR